MLLLVLELIVIAGPAGLVRDAVSPAFSPTRLMLGITGPLILKAGGFLVFSDAILDAGALGTLLVPDACARPRVDDCIFDVVLFDLPNG